VNFDLAKIQLRRYLSCDSRKILFIDSIPGDPDIKVIIKQVQKVSTALQPLHTQLFETEINGMLIEFQRIDNHTIEIEQ